MRLLGSQRRHHRYDVIVRRETELLSHGRAGARRGATADAVAPHDDPPRGGRARREVGVAGPLRDRDDARRAGPPGDGRHARPHALARRRGRGVRVDGAHGRDAQRARRRPAEQVGIAEVGVHQRGANLGQVAAHAAEGGESQMRWDPDAARLDPARPQALADVAGPDVLQAADAEVHAVDPRELGEQGLGAADAEGVDEEVHADVQHVRSVTHGSMTRR